MPLQQTFAKPPHQIPFAKLRTSGTTDLRQMVKWDGDTASRFLV
jgi:hypothetical protein